MFSEETEFWPWLKSPRFVLNYQCNRTLECWYVLLAEWVIHIYCPAEISDFSLSWGFRWSDPDAVETHGSTGWNIFRILKNPSSTPCLVSLIWALTLFEFTVYSAVLPGRWHLVIPLPWVFSKNGGSGIIGRWLFHHNLQNFMFSRHIAALC